MTTWRLRTATATFIALSLVASACGYRQPSTEIHLGDPGRCVPVDVAASPDTASLLGDAASHFNGSPAASLPNGACAFVQVETVDSPVALRELLADWPDAEQLGPAPAAWVPGSTMWGELLNARLAEQHLKPMAPNGTPFARSPLVVAMPAPMAHALGYPHRPVSWNDLERLARDPRGWGEYGHSEWGRFRMGKGSPNFSTTGLDQTVALDASPVTNTAPALEQSVIYYADSPAIYFDTWQRLATKSPASALTYLSAAVTNERSVLAYNTGHAQGDVELDVNAKAPTFPLVAVYPKDGAIESDNPIIALQASWSTADARAGVRLFTKFALQSATQTKVAAAGFRPARGAIRANLLTPTNGVDPAPHSNSVAPASPVSVEHALVRWQADRKRARVLFLFDVSGSMGDPADATKPHGLTKLELAQQVLTSALAQLSPDDDIGLRIFTSKLTHSPSPDWRDVVPMGPLATRRSALVSAIAGLTPQQSSPLYTATHDAFDAVARHFDPQKINAVVVLTDGYNEESHNNNQGALLSHLETNPNVHVFTITYSNDADRATLRLISQETNARNYDARDTNDLPDVLPRVLANF